MTDEETLILEFEEAHPRNDRAKEAAIISTFGHSWVRHTQILGRLTKRPDVVAVYPMLCARYGRVSRRHGLRGAA